MLHHAMLPQSAIHLLVIVYILMVNRSIFPDATSRLYVILFTLLSVVNAKKDKPDKSTRSSSKIIIIVIAIIAIAILALVIFLSLRSRKHKKALENGAQMVPMH